MARKLPEVIKTAILVLTCVFAINSEAQTFSWAKQFGNPNTSFDFAARTSDHKRLFTDAQGNVQMVMTFTGIIDFDPGVATVALNSANGGTAIVKVDPAGNFISVLQLNIPNGNVYINETNGDIVVSGFFANTIDADPGDATYNLVSAGYNDIFIIMLDASGNLKWAHSIGGPGIDEGGRVVTNSAGEVYLSGVFGYVGNTNLSTVVDFDPDPNFSYELVSSGARDLFLLKLSSNGAFVFAKKTKAGLMSIDHSGNLYFTGSLQLEHTPNGNYISKSDGDGNEIWSQKVTENRLEIGCVNVNQTGEVYVSGGFSGNIYIGPSNISATTIQDAFFFKMAPDGTIVWAKQIRGNSFIFWIEPGADGNLYMTGRISSTGNVDMDPGPGSFNLNPKGTSTGFIEKLSTDGNFIWAKQIGGESKSSNRGHELMLTGYGDIITWFSFTGTIDFDPGAGKVPLKSKSTRDIVIHKMMQPKAASREIITSNKPNLKELLVFPNPNKGSFYLDILATGKNSVIEIHDFSGKLVFKKILNNEAGRILKLNIPGLTGSVYSITVQGSNATYFTKMLVK